MALLTEHIKKSIPELYSTDGKDEKRIHAKFFCPWHCWTWYAVEGSELPNGDWEFFGLVDGIEKELGSWTLSQLEEVVGPNGLKIERDFVFEGVLSLKDEDGNFRIKVIGG